MRGAPQRGLARAMVRMSFATSQSTGGLPVRPRRDFQFQNARKPCLCQRITVSGHHIERLAPPRPPLREPYPEESIDGVKPRALGAATEQGELLSQRQVLKNEVRAGSQRSAQSAQQSEYEVHCRPASPPCRPTSSVQIEF